MNETNNLKSEAMAKILVACEESQIITKKLRKLGHEAYSCDLIDCRGGHHQRQT